MTIWKQSRYFILLIGLLLMGSLPVKAYTYPFDSGTQATDTPRVNAPYFSGDVTWAETAIFWFGQNESYSAPGLNYVDVRAGYTDNELLIRAGVVDYYVWYKQNATASTDLTRYDALAVYLDTARDRATAPQSDDYFFLSSLCLYQCGDVSNYRRQGRGNGTSWDALGSDIWTDETWASWEDGSPNDNGGHFDYGWWTIIHIPWGALGLSGPPADGTVWGLGVQLHDQDQSLSAEPLATEAWPETATFAADAPSTWGELAFNPPAYTPPTAIAEGTTTVRRGLNGAVEDAWMGGGGNCEGGHNGGSEVNHGDSGDLFTGSETAVTHFPCFNKSYLRFSLNDIPADKVIVSATLTLHLFGNAGDTGQAQTSWVHLYTVTDSWAESTIHWNNAPLPRQNLTVTQVNPYSSPGDIHWPGDPYTWDATQAVAEAYATGQPLSVALYASDSAQHSSKYYVGSESTIESGRPTLTVTWGRAVAELAKTVTPAFGDYDDLVTYTLSFLGTGNTLTLTDTLPAGVGTPGNFALEGTSVTPAYDSGHHRLTWSDSPASGQTVTLRYTVAIDTGSRQALVNTAELSQAGSDPSTDSATVIANPRLTYLPLVLRKQ